MSGNCILCKKAIQGSEGYIVYQDGDVTILLDIFPRTKGHLMVVPTVHYETVYDLPEAVATKYYEAIHLSCLALRQYGAKGINVGSNIGSVAGQQLSHFSYHVIPRYEKDDAIEIEPAFKDTPWRQKSIKLSDEEMKQICADLKNIYAEQKKK